MKERVIPILAYHSWRFSSGDYVDNDHVALANDLELIDEMGMKVVPLSVALAEAIQPTISYPLVALTFDDGAIYDFKRIEHRLPGIPSGFYPILKSHARKKRLFRAVQPWLHATSFVIASSAAHRQMNCGLGDEYSWIESDAWSDSWWQECTSGDLLAIGNHSWDHNHPSVDTVVDAASGDFFCVDNYSAAEKEIAAAQRHLQQGYGLQSPYFAYPWGHCNEYLNEEYFPENSSMLGLKAAFTTEPNYLRADSHTWRIPRFVCGDHWRSTADLRQILLEAS